MFAMVVFLVECFHNGDSSFLWKQHQLLDISKKKRARVVLGLALQDFFQNNKRRKQTLRNVLELPNYGHFWAPMLGEHQSNKCHAWHVFMQWFLQAPHGLRSAVCLKKRGTLTLPTFGVSGRTLLYYRASMISYYSFPCIQGNAHWVFIAHQKRPLGVYCAPETPAGVY